MKKETFQHHGNTRFVPQTHRYYLARCMKRKEETSSVIKICILREKRESRNEPVALHRSPLGRQLDSPASQTESERNATLKSNCFFRAITDSIGKLFIKDAPARDALLAVFIPPSPPLYLYILHAVRCLLLLLLLRCFLFKLIGHLFAK